MSFGPGWTCGECGFVYDDVEPTAIADAVANAGKRFRAPLTRGLRDEDLLALLRIRPAPDHWSALEYACHVRDVIGVSDERIGRMLAEDKPELPAVGDVVLARRYNEQEPDVVAAELEAAGASLARRLRSVPSDAWGRVGLRDGSVRTIGGSARNVKHEIDHHLLDIGRALRHARGR